MEGAGQSMIPPVGWANNDTPNFATTNCGFVNQGLSWTSSGDTPLRIGFDLPSSWTTDNLYKADISGFIWACTTGGIYNVRCAQNLTLFNAADATNPIVNVTMTIITASTTEFNTVFTTSVAVPITTAPINMSVEVAGIVNLDPTSTLNVTVTSLSGNVTIVSDPSVLPTSNNYLGWNLVAQGAYGNYGIIVP